MYCYFCHDATGNLMGILAIHVDDFIFCGKDTFQRNVMLKFFKIFKVGTWKISGLGVNQTLYASSISPIDIRKGRSLRKK